MSEGRTAILARLRAAQRGVRLPDVSRLATGIETPTRAPEECLSRFRQELDGLGVENQLESTAAGVRARVAEWIRQRRVLSWDPERLPYDVGTLLVRPTLGSSPREEQAAAELGLTGCDGAIAETGSLVLLSGPGRSRAVSLLPPLHVAVLRRSELCFSMGEYFRTHADRLAGASACTFVSGPSRTADIELRLTLGVHGPGKVVVVIGP